MRTRILIVDDEESIREFLAGYLTGLGFEAAQEGCASKGLERVCSEKPDLVLLDMRMPGMDGLTFLRAARAIAPGTAVIVVSGVRDEADARAAMALGAHDYITKPIDLAQLELSVKAMAASL